MKPDVPIGRLFSELYVAKTEPAADSTRARIRLAAFLNSLDTQMRRPLLKELEQELGLNFENTGNLEYKEAFLSMDVVDFLNSITVVYRFLARRQASLTMRGEYLPMGDHWRLFVGDVFGDQGLLYTVDEKGGIHRAVDGAFDIEHASIIAGLQGPRYAAVRQNIEQAYAYLGTVPPDNKAALRALYDAFESLGKLMFNVARISKAEVDKHFGPLALSRLAGPPYSGLGSQFIQSLGSWANAMQEIRHGQAAEEPAIIPEEIVMAAFSAGIGYVRWLAALDKLRPTSP